ncbi:Hypothetical predicted protein [Cloeon dipterum]|uniref:Uncharacterized protein n=1 Tax=Cloeon dipterum TaxID=197152 RepID=A0A8S1DSE7_9INSE|nr:Hypothetical predicted protein [Cloeon dipterum]
MSYENNLTGKMDSDELNKLIGVKSTLDAFYTINKKSFIEFERDSLTPLQVATMIDGVEMCRNLIEEGADVNVEIEELGATLMHCAALNEEHGLDLLDYFSSLGLKLDAKDKFGNGPLQYAIRANNSKIVERLLPPKCPEEEKSTETTESQYLSILAEMKLKQEKRLLADFDVFGNSGMSAIHVAAMLSDLDMCKWLLSDGVDVRSLTKNKCEDNVLHCAAKNKSHGQELVQYFVSEFGFDVDAKDKLGLTPLHRALDMENIETAEELLKLGADLALIKAAGWTQIN